MTYNGCNTLLLEFLQAKSAQKQANAREKTEAASNSEISVHCSRVNLSDDLHFKIFMLLSAELLCGIRFVCKKWFTLINSSVFIKCHAQQAVKVLMCRKLALSPQLFDYVPKLYFNFLNLDTASDNFIESRVDRPVNVIASFEGLVLAKVDSHKCLILTNPMTRKHMELPYGNDSAYMYCNLLFCNKAKTYKVVHLFCKRTGYIDCEILNVRTRTWEIVDSLPFEMLHMALCVNESLYWLPHKNNCDYIIAMNVQDEKFITKNLPTIRNTNDRLLEIGGVLGFFTHTTNILMQVWTLQKSRDEVKENWVKSYKINHNFGIGSPLIPICSRRNGKEIVFHYPGVHEFYVYNFDTGKLRFLHSKDDPETCYGRIEKLCILHKNTLASWENRGDHQS